MNSSAARVAAPPARRDARCSMKCARLGSPVSAIVVRQVLDALLRLQPITDVAHDGHAQALAAARDGAADRLHRNALAVGGEANQLVALLGRRVHHRLTRERYSGATNFRMR